MFRFAGRLALQVQLVIRASAIFGGRLRRMVVARMSRGYTHRDAQWP
jgi:hypothetical protein